MLRVSVIQESNSVLLRVGGIQASDSITNSRTKRRSVAVSDAGVGSGTASSTPFARGHPCVKLV